MADTDSALVFTDGDDLTAALLNAAFMNLDLRMRAFEGLSISYQEAIDLLNQYGLQRLNLALQPVYDKLVQLGSVGAAFTITSSSTNTVGLGTKIFTVKAEDKDRFATAAYMSIMEGGGTASMSGHLQSYDRTTGTLVILSETYTGALNQSFSNWIVMAGADFGASKAYTDVSSDAALTSANETSLALSIALG